MAEVKHYDWESNLKLHIKIMRVIGLWPDGDENYKPGFYTLYAGILVTLMVCDLLSQTVKIYFVRNDVAAVAGIIYVILAEMMTTIKIFFVIFKIRILKKCVINLKNNSSFQPRNRDQVSLIQPAVKFWNLVYIVYFLGCFGCNLFWVVPIVINSAEKSLPFLAWYPFDTTFSPVFEITYIYQWFCTCYFSISVVNIDALICVFNMYIGCQFDLLGDNLKNIVAMNNGHADARKNLLRCIIHHKQILRFVKDYSFFYRWILVWHLILSGVAIGMTMFQLTLVVPLSTEFSSLLSYGDALILQIFMYCYFGNEVQVKSNLVSRAAYESHWTDLPQEMKKLLIIFIANISKPITISGFNIFVLSLNTFIKILKTGWSYFALLRQLNA